MGSCAIQACCMSPFLSKYEWFHWKTISKEDMCLAMSVLLCSCKAKHCPGTNTCHIASSLPAPACLTTKHSNRDKSEALKYMELLLPLHTMGLVSTRNLILLLTSHYSSCDQLKIVSMLSPQLNKGRSFGSLLQFMQHNAQKCSMTLG